MNIVPGWRDVVEFAICSPNILAGRKEIVKPANALNEQCGKLLSAEYLGQIIKMRQAHENPSRLRPFPGTAPFLGN
jgi:hypothetical protein